MINSVGEFQRPFDPSGVKITNRCSETSNITRLNGIDYTVIIPREGPYHVKSVTITDSQNRELKLGKDWFPEVPCHSANDHYGIQTYGLIRLADGQTSSSYKIAYNSLGLQPCLNHEALLKRLAEMTFGPRIISWDQLDPDSIPTEWPPAPHMVDLEKGVYFLSDVLLKYDEIIAAILGDLSPKHQHEISSVLGLQKSLDDRITRAGKYKLSVTDNRSIVEHHSAINITLPKAAIGTYINMEVHFAFLGGVAKLTLGGAVNNGPLWSSTYAFIQGNIPASQITFGKDSQGNPYIWIGDDNSDWLDYEVFIASVHTSSDNPDQLTNGWDLDITTSQPAGVKTAIKTGGLEASGFVPLTRKVNGKALNADIALKAVDVGALPVDSSGRIGDDLVGTGTNFSFLHLVRNLIRSEASSIIYGDASANPVLMTKDGQLVIDYRGTKYKVYTEYNRPDTIGADGDFVPTARKINNKELKTDLTLSANDVKAMPVKDIGTRELADGLLLNTEEANFIMVKLNNILTSIFRRTSDSLVIGAATHKYNIISKADPTVTVGNKTKKILLAGDVVFPEIPEVDLSPFVKNTRKVNGKALNADINLTASDVSALAVNEVGQVAKVMLVNGGVITVFVNSKNQNALSVVGGKLTFGVQDIPLRLLSSARVEIIVKGQAVDGLVMLRDLKTREMTDYYYPVGAPIPYPSMTLPSNGFFIPGHGQTISKTTFPGLYALYGSRVPDLRGQIIKGAGANGRAVKTFEMDAIKRHGHTASISNTDIGSRTTTNYSYNSRPVTTNYNGNHNHTYTVIAGGDNWGSDPWSGSPSDSSGNRYTNYGGNHNHAFTVSMGGHTHVVTIGSHGHGVSIGETGGSENLVKNYSYNFVFRGL